MLLKKLQQQHINQPSISACPRSVVTFYHNNGYGYRYGNSYNRIREEIDLQDFEIVVEVYKFLVTNHRKNLRRKNRRHQLQFRGGEGLALSVSSSSNHNNNNNESSLNSTMVVTELHKQAIVTLLQVDKASKRVTEIRPELFPDSTQVLPACLSRLDCLRCLKLDHCKELSSFPAGFSLVGLEELVVDVSSFKEPFPTSFGNSRNLTRLILYGICAGLDGNDETEETESLLFPSSMARINLRYLETHVQNLLHISPKVLDSWSSSVETLVVTQDLSSSMSSSSSKRNFPADSSSVSDDYNLVDSDDEESDDEEDGGFSILKHNDFFREALRNQLEERTFRSIARFQNLKTLKLLFDDSKYRKDYAFSAEGRNRLGNKRKHRGACPTKEETTPTPYSIPLSLLAGSLSLSLRELDIGTCVASTTSSASRMKSKIPVEVSWIDVLRDFPLLERLRLQDCRCSFARSNTNANDTSLLLPQLKELVLDRCPDFALVSGQEARTEEESSSSFSEKTLEIAQHENHAYFLEDHNGSLEEIVFSMRSGSRDDGYGEDDEQDEHEISLEPVNEDDIESMMEDTDRKEISRIIRLTSLLTDAVLLPAEKENKVAILCHKLLSRCPKLELLSLRDCGIVGFCQDILTCLPRESLLELTIDAVWEDSDDNIVRNNLWALMDVYPSLMNLQGTYTNGLEEKFEQEKLHLRLVQRQIRYRAIQKGRPWNMFFADSNNNQNSPHSRRHCSNDKESNPAISVSAPDADALNAKIAFMEQGRHQNTPPPKSGFRLSWPVSALERKFIVARAGVLETIKRSNSREML